MGQARPAGAWFLAGAGAAAAARARPHFDRLSHPLLPHTPEPATPDTGAAADWRKKEIPLAALLGNLDECSAHVRAAGHLPLIPDPAQELAHRTVKQRNASSLFLCCSV
jgi:hypothetical protein